MGYAKEIEKIYGPLWKAAVNRTFVDSATALTVTLNGAPINAFYFSSSAGVTQNIRDVWGSEGLEVPGIKLGATDKTGFALEADEVEVES
mgnify:CR=1 FL=1